MQKTIVSLEKLSNRIAQLKRKEKRVVLCHGVFHSLHVGHIRYLKQAKNHGDIIVVSLCPDKFIDGSHDLQFNENLRAEAVASLGWIDYVVINPFEEVYELIEKTKPDVFVKGFESDENGPKDKKRRELKHFEKLGVELVVVQENDFISTSQINRYLRNVSEDIRKYVQLFKSRFNIVHIKNTLKSMQGLNVCVIGDTILDEYQYCTAIGKSSKDPTLVLKYESEDLFAGGVLAVANHVAGFADKVDLITVLGEKESMESFIRSKLKGNINPNFLFKVNAPTLVKRRFLDGYSMNKLLEIYVMDDSQMEGRQDNEMIELVRSRLPRYDLVIVADYGHGTINMNLKKLLSREVSFLAVNAQSNAGNRGFNNITQYPRSDFISIAEHEIRLETRDLTGKLRHMMRRIAAKMKCEKIVVTRGRKGCMVLDREEGFFQIPSFAQKVVDRVGAGDSFFALTSLAAARKAPSEVVGFLGNVAGSLAVEVMGNQKAIDSQTVTEYICTLYE